MKMYKKCIDMKYKYHEMEIFTFSFPSFRGGVPYLTGYSAETRLGRGRKEKRERERQTGRGSERQVGILKAARRGGRTLCVARVLLDEAEGVHVRRQCCFDTRKGGTGGGIRGGAAPSFRRALSA